MGAGGPRAEAIARTPYDRGPPASRAATPGAIIAASASARPERRAKSLASPFRNRVYARLFAAQVAALLGTGLLTLALALLAYDLAGADGGLVVGVALTIKMAAYVGLAPVAAAFLAHLPRRPVLVALDLVRCAAALCLPLVDAVWQIYLLVFVLQAASAAFTPAFQASIPDILPDERDYTRALSLSRLAYDLENLASPVLAAALLTVARLDVLFLGAAAGFAASAALVLWARPPRPSEPEARRGVWERTTRGLRIYLKTPRLRGLLALNLAAAAGGAMVIVNTAVIGRALFAGDEADVATAMAFFGAGSMTAALALPRLLTRLADRAVMGAAGASLAALLLVAAGAFAAGVVAWPAYLAGLALAGLLYAAVLTPAGRLLRRSSAAADRPAVFAAQFALAHACWLAAYPLAGWTGAAFGMAAAAAALGAVAVAGATASAWLWPRRDPDVLEHVHAHLPPTHDHLRDACPAPDGWRHAHAFVIDDEHAAWPSRG